MEKTTCMNALNETHDINLKSWVSSANEGSDFPIQNLPFSVFRRAGSNESFRGGVAIGNQVLDLAALAKNTPFQGQALRALKASSKGSLNQLMGMGEKANSELRLALSRALRKGSELEEQLEAHLISQANVEFDLPCRIGDYTDFYTSINHATAVGRLFRPDQPLLPNYKWVPIGYHGRSSTIGISGQEFHRPIGQFKGIDSSVPDFGPSKRLDYELEMGIFVGVGNPQGESIELASAEQHIFGMCIFNDWSARDIQAWEYQPLGPFLGKNFASTISPWIVTMEALAPFRVPFSRPDDDPAPVGYLSSEFNSQYGGLDIEMEVLLQTNKMQQDKIKAERVAGSSFKHSYWTAAQMLTHHTIGGCSMNSGDLMGSGTQSGPNPSDAGSLLELSKGGTESFNLANGEQRRFLEDGDRVVMRAYCEKNSATRIGFGEAIGRVLPSK